MTAQREINVLTDCETFCIAFKLGAKIMLDILTEGTIRPLRAERVPSLILALGYPADGAAPFKLHSEREPIEEFVVEV